MPFVGVIENVGTAENDEDADSVSSSVVDLVESAELFETVGVGGRDSVAVRVTWEEKVGLRVTVKLSEFEAVRVDVFRSDSVN